MSQALYNGALGARRALELRTSTSQRRAFRRTRVNELETKLSALQKDYAELHTAIFEAAQVHRRLCAPRLVRYGDFDIASEIFAIRHLAGDFFTIKETRNGIILALGDVCGKGLAAGMWTTHLVGLVGARAAVSSEPEFIVAGVNRDVFLWPGSTLSPVSLNIVVPVILQPFYCGRVEPWNAFPTVVCCWV